MARRISRKQLLKQDEFVEAAASFEQWVEENWRNLLRAIGAIVVVVLVIVAWRAWSNARAAEAQRLLGQGVESYNAALREATSTLPGQAGEASQPLLEEALTHLDSAAAKAGGSGVAAVSRYYKALTLTRLGRFEEAVPLFEEVAAEAPDPLIAASARSSLAYAQEVSGDLDAAAATYETVVKDGGALATQALFSLGRLHRTRGATDDARRYFQRVLDEDPDSLLAQEAAQAIERLN